MVEKESWDWNIRGEIPITVHASDARFVLACCTQWVPNTEIIRWNFTDYKNEVILVLLAKMLPILASDKPVGTPAAVPEENIELSVGEISYILHFLRGDDSYGGGAVFEKALLKALWELVKSE